MSSTRTFLKISLETGLDCGTVTPEDIVGHVDATALAKHLPVPEKAKLLEAALKADAMNPALVVDTLGIATLSQHIPVHLLWRCVADTASRALGETTTPEESAAKKTPPPPPAAKPQAKLGAKDESGPIPVVAKDAKPTKPGNHKKSSSSKKPARARRPARLAPRSSDSEFDIDIDTDIGEEWPNERTAETLGAAPLDDMSDWQGGEETTTAGPDVASSRKP